MTLCLDTLMIHPVHVIACQESTSRYWLGGSGCFSQILKNCNHFSFFDIVEPGRHPYIGGITITFCIVSTCRRGSSFSVLDAKVSCMFCLWDVVVLICELSCVRVACPESCAACVVGYGGIRGHSCTAVKQCCARFSFLTFTLCAVLCEISNV